MKLNCDLGESYGAWTIDGEEEVMPLIDQANIACGFHAGDPVAISKTLKLAAQHGVEVGAHPGYPDLNGFGRRSMKLSTEELYQSLHYQISALTGMATVQGINVHYVKPHGALYNDMMKDQSIRNTIMNAVSDFPMPLTLMLQATSRFEDHIKEAAGLNLELKFEAFADRGYTDTGALVPRNEAGAMLDGNAILNRVDTLLCNGVISSVNGTELTFPVDSLCVHGDNTDSVAQIKEIRKRLTTHEN